MTAPGDVIGQVVVNVRTCEKVTERVCDTYPGNRCNNCRGDGTWLDARNPTMVERVDVFIQWGSGYMGTAELEVEPDPEGNYWRLVENGDTGDGAA